MRKTALALTIATGFAALSFLGATAGAQEFNARPHLNPALQVKVAKTLARSRRDGVNPREALTRSGGGSECGSLTIGDFGSSKRAPREVVIVAGDIININKNCRRR